MPFQRSGDSLEDHTQRNHVQRRLGRLAKGNEAGADLASATRRGIANPFLVQVIYDVLEIATGVEPLQSVKNGVERVVLRQGWVENSFPLLHLADDHIDRFVFQLEHDARYLQPTGLFGVMGIGKQHLAWETNGQDVHVREHLPISPGVFRQDVPLGERQVAVEPEEDLDEIYCDVHWLFMLVWDSRPMSFRLGNVTI